FTFADAQDIKDVQVAFYKGDERLRTLEATLNGEVVGQFGSSLESDFNDLGIAGVAVHTLKLKPVDIPDNGWIALLEVRFLVDP
uniref:hypothetical protein n=1 Tax=Salmonella sp. s58408 TaxID=3159701 RepID=UPI00398069AD